MAVGLVMAVFVILSLAAGKSTHDATVAHITEAETPTERNLWAGCGAFALLVLIVVIFFGGAFLASVTRGM